MAAPRVLGNESLKKHTATQQVEVTKLYETQLSRNPLPHRLIERH
jgi:hypothetical protein